MRYYLLILLLIFTSCDKGVSEDNFEYGEFDNCEIDIKLNNNKISETSGLIEFDMLPDKNYNRKGAILTSKDRLWEKGIIPYYFQKPAVVDGLTVLGFTDEDHKNIIRNTLKELELQTGLLIPEYESKEAILKDYKDGVAMQPSLKSSAHKGRQGGMQPVNISYVLESGTIKHEMLHTIGFGHEMSRSDRDEHIIILWENISEHRHRQFDIDPLTIDCGNFDITSVMMYGSYQITGDTTKPILLTIDGDIIIQSNDLSRVDIGTVKTVYNLEFKNR